jgi:hypothetical protein
MAGKKQDMTRYNADRYVKTFPPKYCKKLLIGMSIVHDRSISHVTSIIIQNHLDKLPESQRERYQKAYDEIPPEERSRSRGSKNAY